MLSPRRRCQCTLARWPAPLRARCRPPLFGLPCAQAGTPGTRYSCNAHMHPENADIDAWQQKDAVEEVLEPDLEIVDPHHHLWDWRVPHVPGANPGVDLDWDPNVMKQKVYYAEDYAADITQGGHNVVQTVYLECGMKYREDGPVGMRRVGETEFAESQARPGGGLVDGIVGSVNLQLGAEAVDSILAAHLAASPNFKGIRTAFPEDLNEQWQSGYRVLGERGLTWEVAFGPEFRKLPILAKLAAAHPSVTMIINHLGCRCDPSAPDEEFQEWKECLATVAACDNVYIKLGGAQQRMGPWTPPFHISNCPQGPLSSKDLMEILFKWYSHAIDAFGPARCMFESNFPTDREGVSYRTVWNLFKRIAAKKGLSDVAKAQVFAGTARKVYRLPAAPRKTVKL